MGKPSRAISKFVDVLAKVEINAKWAAAFDTYFQRGKYYEKSMKKLEKNITKKLPNSKRITPDLSIRVKGVNGPIVVGSYQNQKNSEKSSQM